MVALSACPPDASRRIQSTFARACARHLAQRPVNSHPRAVDLLWRAAGGRLGNALAGINRVVRDAAARGISSLDLAVVANRLGVSQ